MSENQKCLNLIREGGSAIFKNVWNSKKSEISDGEGGSSLFGNYSQIFPSFFLWWLPYFVYQQRSHNSTLIFFKLEGKLRQIANPQSDKRREHSLKQLESTKAEDGSDDEYKEDEVSFIYYGDYCTCSKNSMCKGSNCLCFLRDEKCTGKCHNDKKKTKCINKWITSWGWAVPSSVLAGVSLVCSDLAAKTGY